MIHAVRSPARLDPPPAQREAAGLENDLSAVLEALAHAATSLSERLLSDARREAATQLDDARSEARRMMQLARAEGEESATRSAAMMSARTRRQAHEDVLAARRSVVEQLRHRAAETVARKVGTSECEALIDYLRSIVNARVGLAPGPGVTGRPATFDGEAVGRITAQEGNRRATVNVADLVDSVLNLLAPEVESLWA